MQFNVFPPFLHLFVPSSSARVNATNNIPVRTTDLKTLLAWNTRFLRNHTEVASLLLNLYKVSAHPLQVFVKALHFFKLEKLVAFTCYDSSNVNWHITYDLFRDTNCKNKNYV